MGRSKSSSPQFHTSKLRSSSKSLALQESPSIQYDTFSDIFEPMLALQKVMLSNQKEALQTQIQHDKTSASELIEANMYNMCIRIETLAELITKCRYKGGKSTKVNKGSMTPETAMILKSYGYHVTDKVMITAGTSATSSNSPQGECAPASSGSESNSGGNYSGSDSDSARPPSQTPSERIILGTPQSSRRSRRPRSSQQEQNTPVESSPLAMESNCSTLRDSPMIRAANQDPPRHIVESTLSDCLPGALSDSTPLRRVQKMNDEQLLQLAVEDEYETPAEMLSAVPAPEKRQDSKSRASQVVPETLSHLDFDTDDGKQSKYPFTRWGFYLSLFICQIVGLQPFGSTSKWSRKGQVYRLFSVVLALAFFASSVLQLVKVTHPDLISSVLGEQPPRPQAMIMDIVLGAGSCLVIPLLGLFPKSLNYEQNNLHSLRQMAVRRHFELNWFAMTSKDVTVLLLMWCLVISERTYTQLHLETTHDRVHRILFTLVFIQFSAAAFHFLFWCRGLCSLVDNYLVNLAKGIPSSRLERSWKIRVALMRRISSGFEACFCLLCLTSLLAVLALLFDVANGQTWSVLSRACILLYLPLTFWQSACVTDSCSKAPSAANSLIRHKDRGNDSFNVVQFIRSSEAGVYIYETRLTKGIVLKFVYFTMVALFSICTNLFDFKIMPTPARGVKD
eukprot:TRINITY_DN10025_c0_g1_i1.p1 TRINITY_DN10025_c0_g1~~TRINITY_DN10025_c0_g1_i1.p1  ORF type:complete len:695 (+),score=115.59 TRINITY_DN10025_c0_g1_i1:49-2085(+)